MAMATDSHSVPARFRFSFRVATLVVCCFNIVAAVYLLQSFIGPLFSSSSSSPFSSGFFARNTRAAGSQYTPEQVERIMETIELWKAAEPLDLINRVKEIQEESTGVYELKEARYENNPRVVETAKRFKALRDSKTRTDQEALEEWRKKKLEEARRRSEAMKAKQDEYIS